MHDAQNTTNERGGADGTCTPSVSGKKKKKKKKPVEPVEPVQPEGPVGLLPSHLHESTATYVFRGISLINENEVAVVLELLTKAFSAPHNLYAKLYHNDKALLQRHFLYYIRQAQEWYLFDGTLSFFGLYENKEGEEATGALVAVMFIVPPECRWNADLCKVLDGGDGRLTYYETFYDDIFERLQPKLGDTYLYLLLLAVDERVGKRGLGTTMVRHSVGMAASRGCSLVLDTSDEGLVGYYARFGFCTVEESSFVFQAPSPSLSTPTSPQTQTPSPLWVLKQE